MRIMKKGSSSQRENVSTQKLFEGHINFARIFYLVVYKCLRKLIMHWTTKIDVVMVGNEVRTKGKHQLLLSHTQKIKSSFPKQCEEFLELL